MPRTPRWALALLMLPSPLACDGATRLDPPPDDGIYGFANGCYALEGADGEGRLGFAVPDVDGPGYVFTGRDAARASRFTMRPSDLGTYLLYDRFRQYLVARPEEGEGTSSFQLVRTDTLETPLSRQEDGFRSPAEWELEVSAREPERYQLKHYQTGLYLTLDGLTDDLGEAGIFTPVPQSNCAAYPELGLDATGEVVPRDWPDGDLFGIAEVHSHMFTNASFGGGSTFHGAPFHRLGVEYALPDCAPWHGDGGNRDVVGFFFDGDADFDLEGLIPILLTGEAPGFNHATAGYPEFTDWPNAWSKATHQTMYYRWIERAYLGGLRLVVQHATGNSVLCDLVAGIDAQVPLYSCNDMVSVDRQIEATRALERYIDAQHGGPGRGWLRIVTSPSEARAVVRDGKLAVVLGIEISNLFDCFLTPRDGFERCREEDVLDRLTFYQDLGVSVIFPVHKFDNGFSAGDGQGGIIEIGNIANTGHYSSFIEDCPGIDTAFEGDEVTFGGLNRPRDDFDAPPVIDVTRFREAPVGTLLPLIEDVEQPSLEGAWCQRHGLTPLGETLMEEIMRRGMLVDIAHMPERSMDRAYELLDDNAYPALKTHGSSNQGRLYTHGGMKGSGFGRCADPDRRGALGDRLRNDIADRAAAGVYASEGLKFDLNGFAGGPRPRFGPDSRCDAPQENPVTYPFTSYDGSVTFSPPQLGERAVDFNEEGMIHIGLLPELIEDARRDGVTDEELEPLFRSVEAFVRMWEAAEARGAALR
ncbi:MAG: hypothetical protein AAF715_26810 [Myxococcota bacterium]